MSWEGKTIGLTTVKHVGDSLALSCAIANLKKARPDISTVYYGVHPGIFANNPDVAIGGAADAAFKVAYTDFGTSHFGAVKWSLCEGFTRSLEKWLGIDIPFDITTPVLYLSDDEKIKYAKEPYAGCVVLNSNIQPYCPTKGYPWWREVIQRLPGRTFVLIGSDNPSEHRMDATGLRNVVDLRGRTTLRDLMALVGACGCVLSPASCVTHIAAALGKPSVVVIGARESRKFTDYPGALHVHSRCVCSDGTWSAECGCTRFKFGGCLPANLCSRSVGVMGWPYSDCMASIPPETVVDAVERQLESHK